MFKNTAISNFKQSAISFWSYIYPKLEKPYSITRWIFLKIVFYITVAFVTLGIALVIGFYSGVITFNQRLVTNDAVILYRSKLPAKLTKTEAKEWSQIKVLQKKLNKKSKTYQKIYKIYQVAQDKKLFPKKR